jgi:hypothetical protein
MTANYTKVPQKANDPKVYQMFALRFSEKYQSWGKYTIWQP